ncbi:MAG: response regulator [Nitrospiraceae bacterium]|nr:response regulator [Nitrospiraceae bacterium]
MSLSEEKVLIIEDERASRVAMTDYLRRKKIPVISAVDGAQGLDLLDRDVAVVVTDLKMPKLDGMEVLREVRSRVPQTAVIMVTAYGDIVSAVEAMKLGATDYLTKPVDPDELYIKIRRVCDARALQRENLELRRQLDKKYGFETLLGISPPMIEVFERIRVVAPTDCTVLITGESGTGKELVAQALHQHSLRKDKPFVTICSPTIPDSLVESELFGHAKGAFTGACDDRMGKFAAADGGTLFIDEVAELSSGTQAKLLRVLEDKTFSLVGSSELKEVDIRLIFATNQDLKSLVQEQAFRHDLFYRIDVVTIQMPPLRERPEDIPLLARHFVKEVVRQNDKQEIGMSPAALRRLRQYQWPGNVRELRNCIESTVVLLQKDEITPADLPEEVRESKRRASSRSGFPVGMSIQDLEREAIEKTLRKMGGSRVKAAEILGLSVRTIQRKINEYGLDV